MRRARPFPPRQTPTLGALEAWRNASSPGRSPCCDSTGEAPPRSTRTRARPARPAGPGRTPGVHPHDAEALGVGHGPGDGAGPGRKALVLERPHGPVPEHRPGRGDHVGERPRSLGPDVDSPPAAGECHSRYPHLAVAFGTGARPPPEPRATKSVGSTIRPPDSSRPSAAVYAAGIEQRCPDGVATGRQEGERHPPAHEQPVHPIHQGAQHAELLGHLGSPDHDHERAARVRQQPLEHLHLAPGGSRPPMAVGWGARQ